MNDQPCKHLWLPVNSGTAQKCEHCGGVRVAPAQLRAEQQESSKLNGAAR